MKTVILQELEIEDVDLELEECSETVMAFEMVAVNLRSEMELVLSVHLCWGYSLVFHFHSAISYYFSAVGAETVTLSLQ